MSGPPPDGTVMPVTPEETVRVGRIMSGGPEVVGSETGGMQPVQPVGLTLPMLQALPPVQQPQPTQNAAPSEAGLSTLMTGSWTALSGPHPAPSPRGALGERTPRTEASPRATAPVSQQAASTENARRLHSTPASSSFEARPIGSGSEHAPEPPRQGSVPDPRSVSPTVRGEGIVPAVVGLSRDGRPSARAGLRFVAANHSPGRDRGRVPGACRAATSCPRIASLHWHRPSGPGFSTPRQGAYFSETVVVSVAAVGLRGSYPTAGHGTGRRANAVPNPGDGCSAPISGTATGRPPAPAPV